MQHYPQVNGQENAGLQTNQGTDSIIIMKPCNNFVTCMDKRAKIDISKFVVHVNILLYYLLIIIQN